MLTAHLKLKAIGVQYYVHTPLLGVTLIPSPPPTLRQKSLSFPPRTSFDQKGHLITVTSHQLIVRESP